MKTKSTEQTALAPINEIRALSIQNRSELVDFPFDLDDSDFGVQEQEEAALYPYVSIRQKAMSDENSDITWGMGHFKVKNTPEPHDDLKPPIRLVVIFWSKARTFFPKGAERPECKSIEGNIGSKFGECEKCSLCKWDEDKSKPDDERKPKCKEGRNLYCFTEGLGPCVLRFGPSGLEAWRSFDNLMRSKMVTKKDGTMARLPYHVTLLEISTEKVVKPGYDPYWVPKIKIADYIKDAKTLEAIRVLKSMKDEYDRVASVTDDEVEVVNGANGKNGLNPDMEIKGAIDLETGKVTPYVDTDGDLPF